MIPLDPMNFKLYRLPKIENNLIQAGGIEVEDLEFAFSWIDRARLDKEAKQDMRLNGKTVEFLLYQGPLNEEPEREAVFVCIVEQSKTSSDFQR